MAGEETNGLIHLTTDLAPPGGLNERGAFHEELQAGELDALVGRQLEENQGLAHGPRVSVLGLGDVKFSVQVLQQLLGPDLCIVQVLEPRKHLRGANDLVVIPALLVVDANRVSSSADLDNLQNSSVAQLLRHALAVVQVGQVRRIWLDAADEVGLGQVHDIHEACKLVLELARHCVLLLLAANLLLGLILAQDFRKLHILLEEICHKLVGASTHALDEIIAELVAILIQESIRTIADGPGEMLDHEPRRLRLDLVKAAMTLVLLHQLVDETLVGTIGHDALFIQH
mmetsp:Transcript_63283/g.102534  ORF Transcript_63283/g.102534 Transcript_63283/m.102534 type:complete len:286 (+) Transcript_63283:1948-2805(+)